MKDLIEKLDKIIECLEDKVTFPPAPRDSMDESKATNVEKAYDEADNLGNTRVAYLLRSTLDEYYRMSDNESRELFKKLFNKYS